MSFQLGPTIKLIGEVRSIGTVAESMERTNSVVEEVVRDLNREIFATVDPIDPADVADLDP